MAKSAAVSGSIFVVPNSPMPLGLKFSDRIAKSIWGSTSKATEGCIEVWMTSDDSDNWSAHGVKTDVDGTKISVNVPNHIPFSVLKDVKEGDTIEFVSTQWVKKLGEHVDVKFTLIANQKDFRYRSNGEFETTVEFCNSKYDVDWYKENSTWDYLPE